MLTSKPLFSISRKTSSLIQMQNRSFYFHLDAQQKNLDFPLNVGFNDNFKYHSQMLSYDFHSQIDNIQFWSLFKIQLRRKQLEKQFSNYYKDLLRAIVNDNYDSLESLCEETLTIDLAAKIYEYQKYRGIQFRIINQDEPINIDILNHFYVGNMKIDRNQNPSLREYKMITRKKNYIDYIPKHAEEGSTDIETLELLKQLKNFYQRNPNSQQQHPKRSEEEQLKEAEERRKFDNSTFVQKEANRAFKEVIQHEYHLFEQYQPKTLYQDVNQYMQEVSATDQMPLEIDRTRLKEKNTEYLEEIQQEVQKQTGVASGPVMIDLFSYVNKEKEKSDLYIFTRIFCPLLYNKYVKIEGRDIIDQQQNTYLADKALSNIKSSRIHQGRLQRFSKWLTSFLIKKNKQPKSHQLIEVFDILVKSKQRLQLYHFDTGTEYICNPKLSDYTERMDLKFNVNQLNQENDSVYIMEVDKSKYDPSHQDFEQIHCMRFEIDRSKTGKSYKNVKITDIDYWLEGNRHSRAQASEFIYTQEQSKSK